MKQTIFALAFLPLLALATEAPPERDWNVAITASGSLSSGERFESIGVANFANLDSLLSTRGGYEAAYRQFRAQNRITYGVWQEAEAFRDFLKECNIEVNSDVLAMRLGLNRVFKSQNDQEVQEIFSELGNHLSFEGKIEFASRLGGMLLQNYDTSRAGGGPNGSGVVTLRQMIEARQNGGKAGVCRDMSQALASALKEMGVRDSYVVAYQTAGGGHATVLVQDPNNPGKTYNINYNFVTSTESGSSLSHLQQDSTIPSVGTDIRIFDANGRPLTALPTHLGVALHEITGGQASDLDPMLRSENQVARVEYTRNGPLLVAGGAALTPDGDRVVGVAASYRTDSENFPTNFSLALYNSQRETDYRGRLNSTGVYIEGEQRVISDPISVRSRAGTASMNFEGRINFRSNISMNQLGETTGRSAGQDVSASAGVRSNFVSTDGSTNINTSLNVTGGLAKADVRDEGSITFDLRDINANARVSQRLSQNLEGFAGGSLIMRNGLGVQAREEAGIVRHNGNGSATSLIFGHEGPVSGSAPAFVPGSISQVFADVRHYERSYGVSGSVFCRRLSDVRNDCGLRTTATLKFGARESR